MRFHHLVIALVALSTPLLADCPKTDEAWKAWGERQIASLVASGYSDAQLTALRTAVTECDPRATSRSPRVRACLRNLAGFGAWVTRSEEPGYSMALSISDEEYFARVPFKGMLELPRELADPAFLKLLDDDATPGYVDKALERIKEINPTWIAFPYRSRHLPTVDETGALGRLFVYVPGKAFDQYLQFGLRHDPSLARPHSASIVAVQKLGPDGKPLAEPLAWLNDLWRVRDESASPGITMSTRFAVNGFLENCYRCHKQAVLPITPLPFPSAGGPLAGLAYEARFGAAIRDVNRKMDAHRSLRYAFLPTESYGPPMGPTGKRDEAFLRSCAGGRVTSPERLAAVGAAMRCARCHDGDRRGALNFPSLKEPLRVSGRTLVEHYVVSYGKMPPGAGLDAGERQALVDCLRAEYYGDASGAPGLLKSWLQQESCWR